MSAAAAHGLSTVDVASGRVLDAYYASPALGTTEPGGVAASPSEDDVRGVRIEPVTTVIEDLGSPPADVADAYLRLHLLSHRLVRPRRRASAPARRASTSWCWAWTSSRAWSTT
jgi:2,3,4,5-tetrahydropyridine-2,6-dicarboxylate N-succinyltransferase